MTCASCAARIEQRLNKLDGVTATVNYATEHAKVAAPAGVDVADLIAQVEAAGYSRPRRPARRPATATAGRRRDVRATRRAAARPAARVGGPVGARRRCWR